MNLVFTVIIISLFIPFWRIYDNLNLSIFQALPRSVSDAVVYAPSLCGCSLCIFFISPFIRVFFSNSKRNGVSMGKWVFVEIKEKNGKCDIILWWVELCNLFFFFRLYFWTFILLFFVSICIALNLVICITPNRGYWQWDIGATGFAMLLLQGYGVKKPVRNHCRFR